MVNNQILVTNTTKEEIEKELDSCGYSEEDRHNWIIYTTDKQIFVQDTQNTRDWFERYIPDAILKIKCRNCGKLNRIDTFTCHYCNCCYPTEPYQENY